MLLTSKVYNRANQFIYFNKISEQRFLSFWPSLINPSVCFLLFLLVWILSKYLPFKLFLLLDVLERHSPHTLFYSLLNISQAFSRKLLIFVFILLQYVLNGFLTTLFFCILHLTYQTFDLRMYCLYFLYLQFSLFFGLGTWIPSLKIPRQVIFGDYLSLLYFILGFHVGLVFFQRCPRYLLFFFNLFLFVLLDNFIHAFQDHLIKLLTCCRKILSIFE